ncbi:luciferase [Siccirubricoccus deserti]|uniref:LLM class flavin-dependent oxidoreductase n=1 Tax=Siccirubricoccus deserti TaxID=2013562 RepID=A0A9X0UES4_9PROT|nr:LLM class flavin-dependent oxidoreductase [Siccirubricoccus deserti]MBC4017967.1 LLM class flavin-dependent oxidoreductase [Siccirubricoccus deserti]GGC28331.1 luciferase [Siccirubricoccus deserti]
MQFGLFYEHQLPRPWGPDAELRLYQQALDQVELADRLGFHYVWEVEHHFLEEYSHSSAPEVFLAACSQRTRNIRLGHGVMLMPTAYNHPARAAERIATLDLVSNGRVDWGTGESATAMEMGGFLMQPDNKTAMWRESAEQAANMLAMEPYPGFKGQYFEMPCRNILPKPAQRPHPPMWMACSRRESIHRAARHGMGALTFAFVEPEQAAHWIAEYYDIIRSEECVPVGHTVNPNVALVSGMSLHADEQEAIRRGLDGFKFFGYSLGYYALFGEHRPGRGSVWEKFQEVKDSLPDNAGRGGIGTPDQVREHLRRYEEIGVDQIIFVQQSGTNRHEHICDSLELFAETLLPEFQARETLRRAKKQAELAPYIAAALARKSRMPPIAEADIPAVGAFGRQGANVGVAQGTTFNDRGGAIPVPRFDPHAAKR